MALVDMGWLQGEGAITPVEFAIPINPDSEKVSFLQKLIQNGARRRHLRKAPGGMSITTSPSD